MCYVCLYVLNTRLCIQVTCICIFYVTFYICKHICVYILIYVIYTYIPTARITSSQKTRMFSVDTAKQFSKVVVPIYPSNNSIRQLTLFHILAGIVFFFFLMQSFRWVCMQWHSSFVLTYAYLQQKFIYVHQCNLTLFRNSLARELQKATFRSRV